MTITATTTPTPRATPRATTTSTATPTSTPMATAFATARATPTPTATLKLQLKRHRLLIYSIVVGVIVLIAWINTIQFVIQDQRIDGFIFAFFTGYSFIISYLTVIISNIYIFFSRITAINKEQRQRQQQQQQNDNNNYNNNSNNNNYNNNNNNNDNNNNYGNNYDRCSLQSICASWCVVGSHLLVTLNCIAGIIVTIFCTDYNNGPAPILYAILWMMLSFLIWWLLKQYRLSTSTSSNSLSSGPIIIIR